MEERVYSSSPLPVRSSSLRSTLSVSRSDSEAKKKREAPRLSRAWTSFTDSVNHPDDSLKSEQSNSWVSQQTSLQYQKNSMRAPERHPSRPKLHTSLSSTSNASSATSPSFSPIMSTNSRTSTSSLRSHTSSTSESFVLASQQTQSSSPKFGAADYFDLVDTPYIPQESQDIQPSLETAPSLVDDASDQDSGSSSSFEEYQSRMDSMIESNMADLEILLSTDEAPPLPERARGHTIPAVLRARNSTIAPQPYHQPYQPNPASFFSYPLDRSVSMKSSIKRNKIKETVAEIPALDVLDTDEMERRLNLCFTNTFIM